MKHGIRYKIAKWLIQHSSAATTYVIEMRNEVSNYYESREKWIAEADCIRRSDAYNAVNKRIEELMKDEEFRRKGPAGIIDVHGVIRHLEACPTVYYMPPKGSWEWEWEDPRDPMSKEFCYCSECKQGHFYTEQAYCPNCGASMLED